MQFRDEHDVDLIQPGDCTLRSSIFYWKLESAPVGSSRFNLHHLGHIGNALAIDVDIAGGVRSVDGGADAAREDHQARALVRS